MNSYPRGLVISKNHPELKYGQVVLITEVTPDLYIVKISEKTKPIIVDKGDIRRL